MSIFKKNLKWCALITALTVCNFAVGDTPVVSCYVFAFETCDKAPADQSVTCKCSHPTEKDPNGTEDCPKTKKFTVTSSCSVNGHTTTKAGEAGVTQLENGVDRHCTIHGYWTDPCDGHQGDDQSVDVSCQTQITATQNACVGK